MLSIVLTIIFFNSGHSLPCNVRTCSKTYTAVTGDYLSLISKKISVTLSTLQNCNPELYTTNLWIGQKICTACTTQSTICTCSKYMQTSAARTWQWHADWQKTTIGYLSDCNPSAKIPTTLLVPDKINLCAKCRISGKRFTISSYYEAVVAGLNANLGPISASGLRAASFAFVTGSGSGNSSIPSWEGIALSGYSSVVTGFSGLKTISFGGSQQGVELAIKLAAANGTATLLAEKYKSIIQTYGSSIILDFDIEGGDVSNVAANNLRSKALKLVKASYSTLKVTYTLNVGASGLTAPSLALIANSISNGVTPSVINIMTMNYGSSTRGLNFDVKAIEATYLQLLSINGLIKLGVIPMIGKDNSGAIRTVADIDSLLTFATTKPYISQFGYWAYHRDIPGIVGVSPCISLSYCAGITGFTKGDYKLKFLSFS